MTVTEIAKDLVVLCHENKYEEVMSRYYADDILSVEPEGPNPVSQGIAAVRAKTEWWVENMTPHRLEVIGPFVHGEQFVVNFNMDVTNKLSGERVKMNEMGVYTVRDGKIVEERFFYQSA